MSDLPATELPDSWGRLGEIPLPTPETQIGKGAFGEVYRWSKNGTQMAVKRVRVTDACAADIERELNIVSRLKHKHIIQCYGVDRDANYVSIIMDHAKGGNLRDAVPRLDWDNKKRIVAEVAFGLAYLHNQGIIHRDIKGANILLTEHDEVKLCDFGLAKVMASATCASTFMPAKAKGTPGWMAPELKSAKPKYSEKSDIFALGVVMQELVVDDAPLEYTEIMTRCLDHDPAKRPTIQDIVDAFHDVFRIHDNAAGGDQVEVRQECSANEEFWQGLRFFFGYGVNTNRAEAAERLRKAATMGDPRAQCFLGSMYQNGDGILRDCTKAAEWLRKAADQEFPPAQHALGRSYLQGGDGVPQDYLKALDLFLAANQEFKCGCSLGYIYLKGLGVEQNHEEALRWYRESASLGCPSGQLNMGIFYFKGWAVEQDYAEATRFFTLAAQALPQAQLYLGYMYEHGRGVPRNYREAWDWYIKAAEAGDTEAQHAVGVLYTRGWHFVRRNPARGLMWLKKAAEQGHEEARYLCEEVTTNLSK
ncbi:hypothetical protein BGX28_008244 [Mortierella sp. GBA30]|nr:hypothetical protein BGX28_008244 [Mortierella sp. GBA30]